jgi:hypothetical protein
MAALVADFDSGLTNTLTFGDFIRLMGAHDFDAPLPTPRLPFGLYEVTFIKPSLGMKIARVLGGRAGGAAAMASVTGSGAAQVGLLSGAGPIEGSRGSGSAEITVLSVSDAALAELVEPGDVIVAVNGAPLNVAGDDVRVLASKLGPLQRPVRVTFAMGPDRYRRAVAEAAAVSAAAGSPSHPGDPVGSRGGGAKDSGGASGPDAAAGEEHAAATRLQGRHRMASARREVDLRRGGRLLGEGEGASLVRRRSSRAPQRDSLSSASASAPPLAPHASVSAAAMAALSDADFAAAFSAFDADQSGDLDAFELAAAVARLRGGERPTTAQVMALLADAPP